MAWKKKEASVTNVTLFNQFCSILLFINIHIFDYPDPRLSVLFRVVPTSPDNRGLTVLNFIASQHRIFVGQRMP